MIFVERKAEDESSHDYVAMREGRAPAPSASAVSSALNLTNTIMGAGVLGLPAAFAQCGLVLGVVLSTALVYVVFFSVLKPSRFLHASKLTTAPGASRREEQLEPCRGDHQ